MKWPVAFALAGDLRIVAALIVAVEIGVENRLHLLDRLEPGAASFDPEVLVQQGAVQSLDDAVGLRALDPSRAMLDLLELQEQLVRMLVGPPAELAAVVGQHGVDRGAVGLEGIGMTSLFIRWTAVTDSLLG